MTHAELLAFLRTHRWAIEATASATGIPQAAIVGFAVSEQLELIFDTLESSRKANNLLANPRIALVIGGWDQHDPRTLQYEGLADFPAGAELERIRAIYLSVFPDGQDRRLWPGITYVRVKPLWVRLSDFRFQPPNIHELKFEGE